MTTIRDILHDLVVDCMRELGALENIDVTTNENQDIINEQIEEYLKS